MTGGGGGGLGDEENFGERGGFNSIWFHGISKATDGELKNFVARSKVWRGVYDEI